MNKIFKDYITVGLCNLYLSIPNCMKKSCYNVTLLTELILYLHPFTYTLHYSYLVFEQANRTNTYPTYNTSNIICLFFYNLFVFFTYKSLPLLTQLYLHYLPYYTCSTYKTIFSPLYLPIGYLVTYKTIFTLLTMQ